MDEAWGDPRFLCTRMFAQTWWLKSYYEVRRSIRRPGGISCGPQTAGPPLRFRLGDRTRPSRTLQEEFRTGSIGRHSPGAAQPGTFARDPLFPCQPFSKAGRQEGLKCPRNGDLFDYVIQVLRFRRPKYFILENVPNLARHRGGETWNTMRRCLRYAGYDTCEHRFSPHQFGIPQVRDRIYIVGSRNGLDGFEWPAGDAES